MARSLAVRRRPAGQGIAASIGGVKVSGGSLVEATGSGAVTITGSVTGNSANIMSGDDIAASTVSTVDGPLTLHGTASGTSAVASAGVDVVNGSVVSATGAGSVTVIGDSTGATSSFNAGVYLDAASLASSGSSGLAITGHAGTVTGSNFITLNGNAYNPFSTGIFLNNASSLMSTGTGSIRLTGTGGTNASTAPLNAYGGDYGVYFFPTTAANTQVISSGGGIAITGTAGTGAGTSFNGGLAVASAFIQDTGDGAVTLTGTAGAGVDNNIGVTIDGTPTKVLAGSGNSSGLLTINGSSSPGDTGTDNNGVAIFGAAQVVSGGGGISITGASPANGTGSNDSVAISGASLAAPNGTLSVTSTAGDITLNATDSVLNSVFSSPGGSNSTLTNPGGPVSMSGGNYSLTQTTNLVLGSVSVQDLTLAVTGNITQSAPVAAALLTVTSANGLALTNPGNNITALGALTLNGALTISTDPGLSITSPITDTAPVTIEETGGDIVFGPNGSIVDSGTGNDVVLAAGTDLATSHYFTNNSTSAIQVSNGANFYIYSSDPTYDTFGNVTIPTANMLYGATYPTSGLPAGNYALFFVAALGDVGPNAPEQRAADDATSVRCHGRGGWGRVDDRAAGVGAAAAGPVTPPGNQVVTTTGSSEAGGGVGSPPPPFSFAGTGFSQLLGQEDGGLANAASNSAQVGTGDAAQLNGGQLNSVANPQASDTLNEALGPIVYQNLADALKDIGDWADVPDSTSSNTGDAGGGETILTGGRCGGGDGEQGEEHSAGPGACRVAKGDES